RIKLGLQDSLYLGNLDAKRDWGHAKDYVEAMWLMLQQDQADDYVIATGDKISDKGLVEETFGLLDWNCRNNVRINRGYFRPAEVETLLGDASKARQQLGWEPKISFKELVRLMVESDLKIAQRERLLTDAPEEFAVNKHHENYQI